MNAKRFSRLSVLGILTVLLALSDAAGAKAATGEKLKEGRVEATFAKLPLSFERNEGQTAEEVRFISRGSGYTLLLTSTEAVLALPKPAGYGDAQDPILHKEITGQRPLEVEGSATVLRMKLAGANPRPRISGLEQLPGRANYFIGSDPKKWRRNVPSYAKVRYEEIYPGIDLAYYGNQGQLEYDFIVAPGADPGAIDLAVEGANRLEIGARGDVVVHTAGGVVRLRKPVVYQHEKGVTKNIPGAYVLKGNRRMAFRVGSYNADLPFIIDPVLQYSTYFGGSGLDTGGVYAVDVEGNIYLGGITNSLDLPVTPDALQPTYAGATYDAFVAKLNAAGDTLVYSTYFGTSKNDVFGGLALDASGNIYISGYTYGTNFPTTPNAFQLNIAGSGDVFLAKLDPTGSDLLYSTYLGGYGVDWSPRLTVDPSGNAYVTGITESLNLPVTPGAIQPTHNGGQEDCLVAKINTNAAGHESLVYCTYLGGSGTDRPGRPFVDLAGNLYVTGYAASDNFPVTPNAFQPLKTGYWANAFLSKLSPTGALLYSTYFGGTNEEFGRDVALDASGFVYLVGITTSSDFPTVNAFQTTYAGDWCDTFLTKFTPDISAIVYSTYMGGSGGGQDIGGTMIIEEPGCVYLGGITGSPDFPVTPDALQPTYGGGAFDGWIGGDVFLAKVNTNLIGAQSLAYSSYLGTAGFETGGSIAMDASKAIYVSGQTRSTEFPTTPNALQPAYGGGLADAFIVKFVPDDDQDGVSNDVENGAPNGGDGNGDGTADSDQANVASLPNAVNGQYVTVASSEGTTLANVRAVESPAPPEDPPPAEESFPLGFFRFTVKDLPAGASTTVTLYLPQPVETYYKYGPEPANPVDHWYEFLFDGTTGAEILGDRVVLHFVDGQRGDYDLAANGEIVEPGAPGVQRRTWLGFLPPLEPEGKHLFKRGSTIPVKFRISDPEGNPVPDAFAKLAIYYLDEGAPPGDPAVESTAAGDWGDQFRYSPEDDLYIFNLSTKHPSYIGYFTYRIVVTLDDGQSQEVEFSLK